MPAYTQTRAYGRGISIKSYADCERFLANRIARGHFERKLPGRATLLRKSFGEVYVIWYQDTPIITYHKPIDGEPARITLRSNGYTTRATVRKLNLYLPDGIRVRTRQVIRHSLFSSTEYKTAKLFVVIGDSEIAFKERMQLNLWDRDTLANSIKNPAIPQYDNGLRR